MQSEVKKRVTVGVCLFCHAQTLKTSDLVGWCPLFTTLLWRFRHIYYSLVGKGEGPTRWPGFADSHLLA